MASTNNNLRNKENLCISSFSKETTAGTQRHRTSLRIIRFFFFWNQTALISSPTHSLSLYWESFKPKEKIKKDFWELFLLESFSFFLFCETLKSPKNRKSDKQKKPRRTGILSHFLVRHAWFCSPTLNKIHALSHLTQGRLTRIQRLLVRKPYPLQSSNTDWQNFAF